MEPGDRCFLWLPWAAPWPLKLCRFMAPAKPLPLETAMASTRSPATRTSAVSCWPTSKPLASSIRSSTRWRPGLHPGGGEVALLGLVQSPGPAHAPGDLEGRVTLVLGGLNPHDPHRRDSEHRDRYGTVLLIPDLGHADLLADDRLGGHGRVKSFRPQWGPAARGGQVTVVKGTGECPLRMPTLRPGIPSGALVRFCPEVPTAERVGARRRRSGLLGLEIGPTCDVTPSVRCFPAEYPPREGSRVGQTF